MKTNEIKQLLIQFESAASNLNEIECWSARELQVLLDYSKWENFEKVVVKAKEACKQAGENIKDHFPDVRKMVPIGSGAEKQIDDILLTRYACYLIAQNGDSRKEKDLAAEMTNLNVQTKDMTGQTPIENEHIDNNHAVREMLIQRGIIPEKLPPAEDIKKLQRKLSSEEKKLLKNKNE